MLLSIDDDERNRISARLLVVTFTELDIAPRS